MALEEQVEREVQRRIASQIRRHNDEIIDLRSVIRELKTQLIKQDSILLRLQAEPLMFGYLLKVHNHPDPRCFKLNDEVVVVDQTSACYMQTGRIIAGANGAVIDEHGVVAVQFPNDVADVYSIGLEGKGPAQVRLAQKADGTYAVVSIDGKPWEVAGIPDLGLKVGEPVKVHPETRAIISRGYDFNAGNICRVVALGEGLVEVNSNKGESRSVFNPHEFTLEEGDRVICDTNLFYIMKKLPRDARERYKVKPQLNITWDSVGGLEKAKEELKDALELPFLHPNLFSYYHVDPLRGVLLYGPPGCGKTLLARVAVWAMAKIHGTDAVDSGYIFVKGPEILDKWVGNTEAEIRELFERGRKHYRQFGYKAILAIDEADAILPQRGTRRSSDIADTIVPMFLGEMDGIDEQQTKENPIVFLMTNRPDILDPAVTRPGRISRHIKIDRPDEMSAIDVLDIHTKNLPFDDEKNRMTTLAVASADMYSKTRLLYRVNNEHDFTLGDACNGAMLENLAEVATMIALHRDLDAGTETGVSLTDFREAVKKIFYQQKNGVNHTYDMEDFCHKMGLQPHDVKVERCFGAG